MTPSPVFIYTIHTCTAEFGFFFFWFEAPTFAVTGRGARLHTYVASTSKAL